MDLEDTVLSEKASHRRTVLCDSTSWKPPEWSHPQRQEEKVAARLGEGSGERSEDRVSVWEDERF